MVASLNDLAEQFMSEEEKREEVLSKAEAAASEEASTRCELSGIQRARFVLIQGNHKFFPQMGECLERGGTQVSCHSGGRRRMNGVAFLWLLFFSGLLPAKEEK